MYVLLFSLIILILIDSLSAYKLEEKEKKININGHLIKIRSTTGSILNNVVVDDNKVNEEKSLNNNNNNINYETRWLEQFVDQFSWANHDTFKQRYLVNSDNWCGKNCPILFYCGNEGDIEIFTNNTGWMWENAKNLHAMLVFAEHRYYGQSVPYNIDTSSSRQDLKKIGYLNSEQALADYARLIYELKNNIFDAKLSPVIAIGGSYGGMLAAWLRMKYPNAVEGALAGSAPILQFPDEYECSQFNKIVTKDFENYSSNCSMSISRSWQVIRDFVGSQQESHKQIKVGTTTTKRASNYYRLDSNNLAKLSQLFNTCNQLTSSADIDALLSVLNAIWVNMAMTDYANEASFLSKMPAYPIKHACAKLNLDPIQLDPINLISSISLASQVYTNSTGDVKCLNISSYLNDPMDTMWDFQSCTEMVMPVCSDGVDDMFDPQPFNVSAFVERCKSVWGVDTIANNVRTLYGDRSLAGASNIIFSSCSRDPWSAGCPQSSNDKKSIHAIKIEGVCHHEDLRFSGPGDQAPVKKARQDELNIITDWIQLHYDRVSDLNETYTWPDAS